MRKFKTALITGASKGIGRATALALAGRCDNFVISSRNESELLELKNELINKLKFNGTIEIILADLSQPDEFEKLTQSQSTVDLLINNAGLGYVNYFDKQTREEINQTIMVNSYSLSMLTHHFCQKMKAQGGGQIINISSIASFFPMPYFSVCAATKSYVSSFSQALDREFKESGVRVKALCPGPTKTAFHLKSPAGIKLEKQIGQLMASPEFIAKKILDLIDGEGSVLTPRIDNKLTRLFSKLLPDSLLSYFGYILYKRFL